MKRSLICIICAVTLLFSLASVLTGCQAYTEAPETEAVVTTEAVTETVEESDMGHFTEPVQEEGCGSTVSLYAMALVVTLGTCTAFVSKKKED